MKPICINHKALEQPKTIFKLWSFLERDDSIYFAPLNRVMPTRFFMCFIWDTKALQRHVDAGSFWRVESKSEIMLRKIRVSLQEAKQILDR